MTFPINTNIPATGDDPADDQPLMQINYANINSYLAVDHVAAGSINNGLHKYVSFLNNAGPTLAHDGQTADAIEYAKLINTAATSGLLSWPVWKNSFGDTQIISGPVVNIAEGSMYLAGGVGLQWGKVLSTTFGTVTFNARAGNTSFLTSCFIVLTTPINSGAPPNSAASISVAGLTNAGFAWNWSGGTTNYTGFNWVAIGI